MTEDCLKIFSPIRFIPSGAVEQPIKILNDLLTRTNNFNARARRNDFTQNYSRLCLSSTNSNSVTSSNYRDGDIEFQHEIEVKETHSVERFLIAFTANNSIRNQWLQLLINDSNYETTGSLDTFVSKLNIQPKIRFEIKERFDPVYNGPEDISRIQRRNTSAISSAASSIAFIDKNARSYKHTGIGQLKIAIQGLYGNRMSIGVTFSNVFNNISKGRDMVAENIRNIYLAVNSDIGYSHYEGNLTINIRNQELIERMTRCNAIIEDAPYFLEETRKRIWRTNATFQQFQEAKEWKQHMINHFFEECQSLSPRIIYNCIELGIVEVTYCIGQMAICTIKLVA